MIRKILILILLAAALSSGCTMAGDGNNETVPEEQGGPDMTLALEVEDMVGRQTLIFNDLNSSGIGEPLIDVTPERVLVMYDIPAGMDKDNTYYFIMGVAARASPESGRIEIRAYNSSGLIETVSADMKDVLDFAEERTDLQAFRSRVLKEAA
jgi:hypothetical protein